jgi:NAD(P)-dependent dehydrogenase (short-subunit alcohol dehydrogenase family)
MTENSESNPTIVVGGAYGIGAAVVDRLRADGAPVVVWDVAGARDVDCDITDPEQIDAAFETTVGRIGVPTRVTVCAGIGHSGMLRAVGVDGWDHVFNVNTRGPWLVMRAAAEAMIEARTGGSIVAVTSVSARLVDRNMGVYCASKAALNMIVEVAACEWGAEGIRVNGVAPGVTNTRMLGNAPHDSGWLAGVTERTALGRIGEADDIAAAIEAVHRLDWVTGHILECDGGLSKHSPIDSWGEMLRRSSEPRNR